jgi:FkbM family methyltransferase
MIASTRWLFQRLLHVLDIDAVCDIGSMNGTDALAFRAVLPNARIDAFEANPNNFKLMTGDARLRAANIHLANYAVTNFDGESEFFIVDADYSQPHHRRGMSSLHRRFDGTPLADTVTVRTTRLDSYLQSVNASARCALWIDVEGKAFEVIDGALAALASIHLLHIEVESTPCIGADQKLYADVNAKLINFGFVEIATDRPVTETQFNAIFVRRDLLPRFSREIARAVALARIRRSTANLARRILPPRWIRALARFS